jgi:hypothetical protein
MNHLYIIKKDKNEKNMDLVLNGQHKERVIQESKASKLSKKIDVDDKPDSIIGIKKIASKPLKKNMISNKKIAFSSIVD